MAIVPGIGFGTIATGSLIKRVVAEVPDANRLECALHIATAGAGAGTGASVVAGLRTGGRIRRGGRLVEHPLGAGGRDIPFATGTRRASPVPTGDLEAAWMDTHIPDIVVYGTALPGGVFQRAGIAILRRLLWIGAVRRAASSIREGQGGDGSCQAWACATNGRGETAEARLETGEGFAFTAAAAARAVAVIRRAPKPGAHAAATVLGATFIESLPMFGSPYRPGAPRSGGGVRGPAMSTRLIDSARIVRHRRFKQWALLRGNLATGGSC